jgi:hypothetical protein
MASIESCTVPPNCLPLLKDMRAASRHRTHRERPCIAAAFLVSSARLSSSLPSVCECQEQQ